MKKRGITRISSSLSDLATLRASCDSQKPLDPQKCVDCLQNLEYELKDSSDPDREIELLRFLIACCMNTSRFELAESYLKKVVKIVEGGYDLSTIDMIHNTLGRINLIFCKYQDASQDFHTALQLSEKMGKPDNIAGVCMNLSGAYSHLGQQDKSLFYMKKALNIFDKTDNLPLLHMVKCNYANMLFSEGKLNEAIQIKLECIAYYEDQKQLSKVAQEKNNLASIYGSLGNLEKAIETILESMKIREELGDEAGIATNWLNLGVFYRELGKDEEALVYSEKALGYYRNSGDKQSIPLCLNNIGNYYLDKGEHEKALGYMLEARQLKLEIEDMSGLDTLLENISLIYQDKLQDYLTSIVYAREALEVNLHTQNKLNRSRIYQRLAVCHTRQNQFQEAWDYTEMALKIIDEHNYTNLKPDLYLVRAEINEGQGDLLAACQNLKEYNRLLTEQHRQENLDRIAEMQTRYETEKKEKEAEIYRLKNIELENKNREIEEQKNKLEATIKQLNASEIRYNFVSEELIRNIGSILIGRSEIMKNVSKMISMVAKSENTNVLITGETGTGKEIVARSIHQSSHRGKQHFYAVNCSAITETLFESQFFGHEKDAFTGATTAKPGWFEIANHSTLFLDEIGTLSFDQQAKLLRALEERCIVRVGAHREIPFDVRIISATNLNLTDRIDSGDFRRDLFHRLAIFVINIPPLRERKEDIPLLMKHFLVMASKSLNKKISRVGNEVLDNLMEYDFPGNVRELKNMVERAILVTDSSTLSLEHFNIPLARPETALGEAILPLEEVERDLLVRALKASNYNRVKAARLLRVDRKVVERKIIKHGIAIPE